MRFSIVVPVYKVENYIKRCVDSLRMQTFSDIEIILVDDGSPDNCPEICDKYAQVDSRIKVIHKENGGLSDARNFGLTAASGEYIIFVDSDDYVERDMCLQFEKYANKGYDVLVGTGFFEGGYCDMKRLENQALYTGEDFLLASFRTGHCPFAVWLNAYRRDFLLSNDLMFRKGILHEDEDFTPRVMLRARSVYNTNNAFYHYVIRENSITTKTDKQKNIIDIYDTCCRLEKMYADVENDELKLYLLNSLVSNYLNIFWSGALYKYGDKYVHKNFACRNAYSRSNKIKAFLFSVSPRFYCIVSDVYMFFWLKRKKIG